MKKIIPFIMTMIIVLMLAACGNPEPPPNPSQPPVSAAEGNFTVPETQDDTDEIWGKAEDDETAETATNEQYKNIKMTIGEVEVTAELDDSEIARQFAALLPQTISMNRGRDREYYGRIDGTLDYDEGDIQTTAEDGDLAYWFSGNSLAFFFNTENDSAVNSGIVVFGKITSDLSVFNDMGSSEIMTVQEVAELTAALDGMGIKGERYPVSSDYGKRAGK